MHTVIVCPIFTVIQIILSSIGLKRVCILDQGTELSSIRNFAIAGSISLCLSGGIACINSIHFSGLYVYPQIVHDILFVINLILITAASLTLHLHIIFRLKNVFEESAFKISNRVLYSYYTLLVIMHIAGCVAFVHFHMLLYDIAMVAAFIYFLLLMIIAIHVCYTFNRNLFRVILAQRQSKVKGSILSEHQTLIIDVIVKYTVLNVIVMISFAVALLSSGIGALINFQYGCIMFLWTFGFAITITMCCILLSFKSMDTCYFSCFGSCDSLTSRFYVFLAERKVKQKQKIPDSPTSEI